MGMFSLRLLWFMCLFGNGILISQITAQNPLLYKCFNDKGNYTANSTYQTNLYTLLSNISSNTQIDYGFYNFSYGQNSDQVNAIGLCRGDVKPDACRSCLNDSRVIITQRCPDQKEAIGWIDNCMLRYSNRSIFHKMESGSKYFVFGTSNATDVDQFDQFNQVLMKLVSDLRGKAVSGNSLKKYAAGSAPGPSFQTIFALLQCTPDLSEQQCDECLVGVISNINNCCAGKRSGIIVCESCHLRFDTYPSFDTTSDAPPPPPPPPPLQVSPPPHPSPSTNFNSTKLGKSDTSRIVIAVVLPVVAGVLLLILVCIYLRLRKPRTKFQKAEAEDDDDEFSIVESLQFDFHSIKDATNSFSDSNKLGQGGFGAVYMGRLPNGQEIAVKRLSRNSGQGDLEFKNEVMLVAKLQHRNLVRLLGFCLKGRERLLIYEFVANKSLDYFIFDQIQRFYLDWQKRYKIIEGIAKGLLYLHEDSQLRIVHRDLKASNILLDEEMNPKISDFGMARLFKMDQSQENTNIIVGTQGYIAPEYAMHGHFSIKSDVFSFGVLVLEIITGLKNNKIGEGSSIEHLVSFVWRNWREGKASNIVDSTLNGASTNEIMKCIHIGLLCVQQNAAKRPTMASVMLMLDSNSATLPKPSQPAFVLHGRGFTETQSVERNSGLGDSASDDIQASVNEASNTELYPR